MFGSLDIHMRKSVQMHSLAKYYASLMESSVHKELGGSFRSEGQLPWRLTWKGNLSSASTMIEK